MKNIYEIEFYDLKQGIGQQTLFTNKSRHNKKESIKYAKACFKGLCNNDKEHLAILVNKYDQEFGEWNCIFEIKK